jgi:hypothetical protein
MTFVSIAVVIGLSGLVSMAAHFTQPSIYAPLARWNSGVAYPAVFLKSALFSDGPDMYAVAIGLKEQPIARSNAQDSANLDGHCNLSLARNFGL